MTITVDPTINAAQLVGTLAATFTNVYGETVQAVAISELEDQIIVLRAKATGELEATAWGPCYANGHFADREHGTHELVGALGAAAGLRLAFRHGPAYLDPELLTEAVAVLLASEDTDAIWPSLEELVSCEAIEDDEDAD